MSDAALRDRIEYLEAENANLRTQLRMDQSAVAIAAARKTFGIEPAMAKTLLCLLDGRLHPRESLFHSLYSDRLNPPEIKVVDVYICKLRRALNVHGVAVKTIFACGYQMAAEDCAKVRAILGIEAKP